MKLRFAAIAIAVLGLAALVSVAAPQAATRSVWSGVYTAGQAKQGQTPYANACAACHGDDLEGGNVAPPLSGDEFMSNWNGHTVGELFDRIRTTMPADHPGTLSPEDTANLVALILSSNKFPAGESELPHDSEALKQITLDAKNPEK